MLWVELLRYHPLDHSCIREGWGRWWWWWWLRGLMFISISEYILLSLCGVHWNSVSNTLDRFLGSSPHSRIIQRHFWGWGSLHERRELVSRKQESERNASLLQFCGQNWSDGCRVSNSPLQFPSHSSSGLELWLGLLLPSCSPQNSVWQVTRSRVWCHKLAVSSLHLLWALQVLCCNQF